MAKLGFGAGIEARVSLSLVWVRVWDRFGVGLGLRHV